MKGLILAATAFWAISWGAAPASGHQPQKARESYQAKVRAELKELGAKIDALDAQAKKEGAKTRAHIEKQLKALRAEKAEANKTLEKLESATAEAWDDLKEGVDHAMAKLRTAYRKVAARLAPTRKPSNMR